ncbi:MAG: hypothetical protein FWF27_00845 [Candidatus Bathyarchaeota archaeon]|nr:hypothetical protein [Candidatus Termiticorpusculum sp.]
MEKISSKAKYIGMLLVAIAIYYLTIFVYCRVMNYYYLHIIHARTFVNYVVSQTNTFLIVTMCGAVGVFILYQSQKSNKENISKLIRHQLLTTATWFTIPLIYELICYICNIPLYRWTPFLQHPGILYVNATIWLTTILCYIINHNKQKKTDKTNTITTTISNHSNN